MKELRDKYNRKHNYLRISLTDKCNLNCLYCNPLISSKKDNYINSTIQRFNDSTIQSSIVNKKELLSFEEIYRIIRIFSSIGFDKFRFTGGEPLIRRNITDLFKLLYPLKLERNFELLITTNGLLLEDKIEKLRENGIDRVNVSLDSLNRDTFIKITGHDYLDSTLSAINKLKALGIPFKINTVVMKGINDLELLDFCRFASDMNINVRFIEFMPFSNNGWDKDRFMSSEEMLQIISKNLSIEKFSESDSTIAKDFRIIGSTGKISFINSISDHFCSDCNRLRITSDGKLKLCLFSTENELLDLKYLIRNGLNDYDIIKKIDEYLILKKFEHPPIDEIIKLKNNDMLKIGG